MKPNEVRLTMINVDEKPSSAEAMYMLAEAYVIEDHAKEGGRDLRGENTEEFEASRRKLEIWTLSSAANLKDPGTWASTKLLDALKYMNGRALEQVPNLHFMAEEAAKQGAGSDLDVIAKDIVDQEIRKACEAWMNDCKVSCTIDEVLEKVTEEVA